MSREKRRRDRYGNTLTEKLDLSGIEYVIYCRRSDEDEEKQKQSVPNQIEYCLNYAFTKDSGVNLMPRNQMYDEYFRDDVLEKAIELEENGRFKYIVDRAKPYFVIFEHKSAKRPGVRPKRNKLMQLVYSGKIRGIISYSPDRQCRNMLEGGQLITYVDENKVDLKYSNYHFENTADGKMMLGIRFVFSKQYSDKLSQDVSRGNEFKRSQGGHLGTFKLGYDAAKDGYYKKDASSFEFVKQAFHHKIYDGWSNKALADFLIENGVQRTYKKTKKVVVYDEKNIASLWRDPFYFGILESGGKQYDQRELNPYFEPMITEEEHEIIMQMYEKKARGTFDAGSTGVNDHLDPIGESLFISEDGHKFTFYARKKEDFQVRIDKLKSQGKLNAIDIDVITNNNQAFKPVNTKALSDKRRTKEITYAQIEPYLIDFFDKIVINDEEYVGYIKYYRDIYKSEKSILDRKNAEIDAKIQKIDSEITDLVSRFAGTQDIDEQNYYEEKKRVLNHERVQWESSRANVTNEGKGLEKTLEEFLKLTKKIGLLFKQAPWVRRRKLINLYVSNLVIHRDNTVTVRLYPQLEFLNSRMVGDEGFEPTTPSV